MTIKEVENEVAGSAKEITIDFNKMPKSDLDLFISSMLKRIAEYYHK